MSYNKIKSWNFPISLIKLWSRYDSIKDIISEPDTRLPITNKTFLSTMIVVNNLYLSVASLTDIHTGVIFHTRDLTSLKENVEICMNT